MPRTKPMDTEPKPAPRDPDDDLVAAALIDHRAFSPLYRRHVNEVYSYCSHRLATREAAEDATSLTFAKALSGLPGYRGGSFRGWLFGIAHHVVADSHRRARPESPLEVASRVPDTSPSPEELATKAETTRTLHSALEQLPPAQRQVVELRLAVLTSAEIAMALGKPPGAVDVSQCRAVARLRVVLGVKKEMG